MNTTNVLTVNGTDVEIEDTSARTSISTINATLLAKADKTEIPTDFYTKAETELKLSAKRDVSNSYDKPTVDTLLSSKADTSSIPTTIAQLTDDSTHRVVTDTEKSTWNGKSDFSGDYNDLSNKPTIPVVPNNVSAFTNDSGYLTLATLPIYNGVVV